MTWAARWHGVSLFGRTFLLLLATFVLTSVLGFGFLRDQLPTTRSSSLIDVARALRTPEDGPRGGPRPPGGLGPPHSEDGAPPGPPPGGGFDGPPSRESTAREDSSDLIASTSASRPDPAHRLSLQAADSARLQLAQLLGVKLASVIVFTESRAQSTPSDFGPTARLSRRFLAARELPDGRWRVVERGSVSILSALTKRGLVFLGVGIISLVPLAWMFARAVSAPLRRFADAARRLGQDATAPLLPHEGSAEMRIAVDSFNGMQLRITRLIQERTQMVGAIAHDLRTPLTRLAFRLDDLPAPVGEKVAHDIQEMKSMISAALDFLKDRSLTGQHEPLDLRLLVERVVNDQIDLGHDVALEPGPPITIIGVPLALRRMVANLVDNALKYGERARLRLRESAGRSVLEIDDDGPGIPESLHGQVFEPFYRLEASRNRDTGGIGLGLSTVRAIVLDHGGDITLGNRRGGGLRIAVTLPLEQ